MNGTDHHPQVMGMPQLKTSIRTKKPPNRSHLRSTDDYLRQRPLKKLVYQKNYLCNCWCERCSRQGELTERTAGEIMKLPYGVMKELFTLIQKEKYCEVKGHGESLGVLLRYVLTEAGRDTGEGVYGPMSVCGPCSCDLTALCRRWCKSQPVNGLTIDRADGDSSYRTFGVDSWAPLISLGKL